MTLQEQWEQDVDRFGDNAHKMWLFGHIDDEGYEPATCNKDILEHQHLKEFSRKESAALPFDLERAKAGDAVEVFYNNYWFKCLSFEPPKYSEVGMVTFLDSHGIKNTYVVNHDEHLRMKYPPTIRQEQ